MAYLSGTERSKPQRAFAAATISGLLSARAPMIETRGFVAAVEAADASEALTILQNDDEIGILLTDLGLPGMNGRQLVEEALRLKPGLKIIIASGYSTREDEGTGLPRGVQHLSKPFDMAQLRRVLGV